MMAPVRASKHRPSGPLKFAAAVALFAIGTAGCTIDLSDWRPDSGGGDSSPTPEKAKPVLESALKTLNGSPGVAIQGQLADSEESDVSKTSLTVTDSGATSGTIEQGNNEAEVMQADGHLFAKAADKFWLGSNITNPDSKDYAGNWVRVTSEQLGVNPAETLTPTKLSHSLNEMAPNSGKAKPEKLDGTDAYRIDLQGGDKNRVWVSQDKPHKLLRVEVEQLGSQNSDTAPRARLDLSEPENAEVQKVYDDLTGSVEGDMKSSHDARIPINWDGDLNLDCKTGGKCKVEGTLKDDSTGSEDSEGTVQVKMKATLKNSDLGKKTCSDTGSLKAGKSVDLSCSVDYDLSPSSSPQSYEINGGARPSTQGMSDSDQEDVVETLKKEQKATLNEDGSEDESSGD